MLRTGDLFQIAVAQLDEAARRDPAARDPSPPAGHHRCHDRPELKDVVLADEVIQVCPWPTGQCPRITGYRGVAQPEAFVPVPCHPGPAILGHLTLHEARSLKGLQQIEDRAVYACPVGCEHEYRDSRRK